MRLAPGASGQVTGMCGPGDAYLIQSSTESHFDTNTDGDETLAVACNADGTLDVVYTDPDEGSATNLTNLTNLFIHCKRSIT